MYIKKPAELLGLFYTSHFSQSSHYLSFELHSTRLKCEVQNRSYSSKSALYRHHGVSISDSSKQEESSHLLPASLVYSKSVHKVFIALFVEYSLCFLLCHNLRLHMLKTCWTGKRVLSVSCARFKSHIRKSRPPPQTLRPRNSCICPCLSRRRRSTQVSKLCPFSSRRQAE